MLIVCYWETGAEVSGSGGLVASGPAFKSQKMFVSGKAVSSHELYFSTSNEKDQRTLFHA
jgi:hypothetical protein